MSVTSCRPTCLPHLSRQLLGDKWADMSLHSCASIWVPHLSPTQVWQTSLGHMSVGHLSPTLVNSCRTCLPLWVTSVGNEVMGDNCGSHLSLTTVGDKGPTWVYTHVGPRNPQCLPLWETSLWADMSVGYTCLPLMSLTLVSHSGWQVWADMRFTLVNFHLSAHTCLPLWVPERPTWVYTQCGPTCLPHLSPTVGALGRMSLHCVNFHLSSALVSHSGCLGTWQVYTHVSR